MNLKQMLAAFELIIVHGVDNPTTKQIADYIKTQRKPKPRS